MPLDAEKLSETPLTPACVFLGNRPALSPIQENRPIFLYPDCDNYRKLPKSTKKTTENFTEDLPKTYRKLNYRKLTLTLSPTLTLIQNPKP